jgi:hypothetical protein
VRELFERVPEGWSEVVYDGRRYGVTRTVRLGGRQQSVYAEELGGTDVVSANLYLPDAGEEAFRPCEMPAAKVRSFLAGLRLLGGDDLAGRDR